MKLFRDFLEECIGKQMILWLKSLPQTDFRGSISKVETDFIVWYGQSEIEEQYLYIPINNIDTFCFVTQNSEN